jgi:hypothetical protein
MGFFSRGALGSAIVATGAMMRRNKKKSREGEEVKGKEK